MWQFAKLKIKDKVYNFKLLQLHDIKVTYFCQ